jgi:hypothetical protein
MARKFSRGQVAAMAEQAKGKGLPNRYAQMAQPAQLAMPAPGPTVPAAMAPAVPAVPKIKMPTKHPAGNLGKFLHPRRGSK